MAAMVSLDAACSVAKRDIGDRDEENGWVVCESGEALRVFVLFELSFSS